MSEFFRDPMWQFVGAIVTIIAVLTSVTLSLKQRKKKKLSYEIVSSTPLVSEREEYRGKLKIFFEKRQVEQVHLVVVKISNSGSLPITVDDYERKISINVGKEAQILTAEITNTEPKSLEASVGTMVSDIGDEVSFNPVLLNEGDSVTLRMLVAKFSKKVVVDGRIVGVKDIRESKESPVRLFLAALLGFSMTMLGMLVTLTARESFFEWVGTLLMIFGLPIYVLPFLLRKRTRRTISSFVHSLTSKED